MIEELEQIVKYVHEVSDVHRLTPEQYEIWSSNPDNPRKYAEKMKFLDGKLHMLPENPHE